MDVNSFPKNCCSSEGRLSEAAALLAAAILRLHIRAALAPANSATADLEVSDETVLSVTHGLTVRDLKQRSET